jgi:alginate O-acetyltransferase complex protein AlgI
MGEGELVLLMFLSCLFNYFIGIQISNANKLRKLILFFGVGIDVLILIYFKYFNFIIDSANATILRGLEIEVGNVHLPIGISFFTFQAISYLVDVYRKEVTAQRNPLNLSLYISLFPQLVAGPIVRYQTIAEEIKNRTTNFDNLYWGIRRFIVGLGKKVLIANAMGELADSIFNNDFTLVSPAVAWLGLFAYSIQIYFDFSGYSDMAIGLGRMFGFNFLENFNSPFVSKNIQEFWRRWHISLSTWFRDYIYFPLGGNRNGLFRSFLNLMVVFFVTGLWHGASWNFVIWGLFHGMFIIFEKLGLNDILKKSRLLAFSYTMLVVNIGWLLFRLEDLAASKSYALQLLGLNDGEIIKNLSQTINIQQVVVLILGSLMSIRVFLNLEVKLKSIASSNATFNRIYQIGDVVLPILVLIVSSLAIATSTYNPFIYFRF